MARNRLGILPRADAARSTIADANQIIDCDLPAQRCHVGEQQHWATMHMEHSCDSAEL